MIHIKSLRIFVLVSLLIAVSPLLRAAPLGSAFSYQGQLTSAGSPANGNYDLVLALFDDPTFGSQVGSTVTNLNVVVSNGLFTTLIDFGPGIFDGTAYWLAIGVRSNGSGADFTALSPRQPVTPSPYALYATVAPLLDNAVTSAKILDGTIANADLGNNSVTTTKILDGTIANADLANDSVNSAKVLDASLLGADLANNTVTSAQLADTIALGDSNSVGRLDVFFANTASNQPSITLFGNAAHLSTYGSDSREQIRLWGLSYGEIFLYDNSTANNVVTTLSANGTGGGFLELNRGNTNQPGVQLYGGTTSGGRELLFTGGNHTAVDIRAQFSAGSPGAWMGLYHTNQERITFAAQNGTTGRGGLIDVKNNSTQNTLRLVGDSGASQGSIELHSGATLVGELQGHSGGSWLRTYDETGAQTAIIGSSAITGGFCELRNASGAVGLRLDGEDGGGGLVQIRNAAGAVTITLDGDLTGDGRITTQELQITGGSDLSEQFDISPLGNELKPGMIVSIDPQNPGQLMPSTKSYDRTVAGVISGAGGVKPGMLMGQKGTKADGQHPVALTGRVYCWVDATHSAVEPGDLITTSDTPGHGMKVADYSKAHGAVIGKAMTSLPEGKGLVLLLVSLQ